MTDLPHLDDGNELTIRIEFAPPTRTFEASSRLLKEDILQGVLDLQTRGRIRRLDVVNAWQPDLPPAPPEVAVPALDEERRQAADREFERSPLLEAAEEADGWETVTGTDTWTRIVYLAPPKDREGPTTRRRFVVHFHAGTARIADAHLAEGCL